MKHLKQRAIAFHLLKTGGSLEDAILTKLLIHILTNGSSLVYQFFSRKKYYFKIYIIFTYYKIIRIILIILSNSNT